MTPVRLEPATPRSRDKHSTTQPLRFLSWKIPTFFFISRPGSPANKRPLASVAPTAKHFTGDDGPLVYTNRGVIFDNPFMPSGIFLPYQLEEYIFNLRVVGGILRAYS